MTSHSIPDTLKELNELCQFFMKAEDDLKQGQVTDLTGVDQRVSDVCKTVQAAMPLQQKEYLPLLTTLIDLLNGYEQSLRVLQEDSSGSQIAQNAGN